MGPGITFVELLAYKEQETRRWREWFASRPEALDRPCDIGKAGTVRELLFHIFAVELFFAYKVLELKFDWGAQPSKTVDDLFGLSEEAGRKFQEFFAKAQSSDWDTILDLGFNDLKVSKRKIVSQAFLHSIHHRAQLATFLRQQGFDGMWAHDLILTDVMQ